MDPYSILFIIIAVLIVIIVIDLVRKNKLQEKYSIFWLIFSVIMLILAFVPDIIDKLSIMLNIDYAPSLLFLVAILFLFIYNLHTTTIITSLHKKILNLTQELSILKADKESSKNDDGGAT